jgi:polar amino acid transport system substrate-binding protein
MRDIVRVLFENGRPSLLLGLTIDFNDRARFEDSMALVMDVIAVATEAEELDDILSATLKKICLEAGWSVGQAWLPDEQEKSLFCASSCYVAEGLDLNELRLSSLQRRMEKGEGLPGSVWSTLTTRWIAQPSELEKLPLGPALAKTPLKSAIAFPLKQGGKLMAVLEFFSTELFEPDEYALGALEKLSNHLSTILQRRQMKSQLYDQWQETQVLLDLIPAFVWYKDTHNRILRCNRAAAEAIGLSVKEVEGRSTQEFYPQDASKYFRDDVEVINSGQAKLGISETVVTASGKKLWVRTDKVPVRRIDGTVAGLIVFSVDVTQDQIRHSQMLQDRRELQSKIEERTKSLRITESKLSSLSRLVPGVLYQYVLCQDGTAAFPYVSDAARTMLEFDPDELQHDVNFIFDRLHADDQAKMREAMAISTKNLTTFKFEGRIYTGSGQMKWIQAASTPELQANGDILWNGIVTDITDLKQAQEKIRQLNEDLEQRVAILGAVNKELELLTHKLEISYDQAMEASRLKSEFVANISHEVRTPISAVIGMSELLMDTPLTEEQREFTRLVRESALSLLTIINDILDFSKMEAGKIDLELIEFGLVALVEGCAELLASSSREGGLSLMTHIDAKVPRMLKGDPVRLRQVLLNLVSNAIKFTECGEVIIRVTLLEDDPAGPILRFEVSDTGIGLPEPARKLLFQPFVQADGSTSRKYGGTGLGLSISKRLVELMGGAIGVDSVPGVGSNFWFTVPIAFDKYADERKDDHISRGIKALIFDQSASSASIVAAYLQSNGIDCSPAADEPEALRLIKDAAEAGAPFHIALIGTTDDTGDESRFVQALKNDAAPIPTRLLLLSTFDDRERVEAALKQGYSACLSKPIRQAQLSDAVNRVLSLPAQLTVPDRHAKVTDNAPVSASRSDIATEKPILVAEDNPVMQELAVRRIRKMGLQATAVNNGRQVLQAIAEREYALILMDCQMPEMDGFEATAAIRRQEATTGTHTPIVAMTASAMIGDREHCITSGMDDYLSKPVSQEQLIHVLRKWLPAQSNLPVATLPLPEQSKPAEEAEQVDSPPASVEHPIDMERLEKLYGKDDCCTLLTSFVQESADLAQLLEEYSRVHDAQLLAQQAHQLKGLASVMTAERLSLQCLELERAVKDFDWPRADLALGRVQAELGATLAYVTKLMAERGAH